MVGQKVQPILQNISFKTKRFYSHRMLAVVFFIQFSLIPPLILLQLQDYQKVFQSILMSS